MLFEKHAGSKSRADLDPTLGNDKAGFGFQKNMSDPQDWSPGYISLMRS
jgi:hypothetical protein